jgi:hypothetical protein
MADVIGAVRVVELTNVVTSGVPPNKICELAGGAALLTKSAPVTVKVNPGALGAAPDGFSEEMEGALTVNGTPFEVTGALVLTPPDWDTVMVATSGAVSRLPGIVAASCVLETKDVLSATGVPPGGVKLTTEPGTGAATPAAGSGVKFVPLTIICALDMPAEVEFGTTDVIVGAGVAVVISMLSVAERTLPQASVTDTVNWKFPAFVGVPTIVVASDENERPSGNAPAVRRLWYAGVPPVKYFWEYALPTIPEGRVGPRDIRGGKIWNAAGAEVLTPPKGEFSLTATSTLSGALTRVLKSAFGIWTVIKFCVTVTPLVGPKRVVLFVSVSNHDTETNWVGSNAPWMKRVKLGIGVPEVMAGGSVSTLVGDAPKDVITGVTTPELIIVWSIATVLARPSTEQLQETVAVLVTTEGALGSTFTVRVRGG